MTGLLDAVHEHITGLASAMVPLRLDIVLDEHAQLRECAGAYVRVYYDTLAFSFNTLTAAHLISSQPHSQI